MTNTLGRDAYLELLLRGGSCVSRENLTDLLAWYKECRNES